jgi:hypothetical protein
MTFHDIAPEGVIALLWLCLRKNPLSVAYEYIEAAVMKWPLITQRTGNCASPTSWPSGI